MYFLHMGCVLSLEYYSICLVETDINSSATEVCETARGEERWYGLSSVQVQRDG